MSENIAAAVHFIKPKLNAVRLYLTQCRLSDFDISEEQTSIVEKDFVKLREETNLQVEHLHSFLVISRLVGISMGKKCLDLESWDTAKKLEFDRLSRVEKKAVET